MEPQQLSKELREGESPEMQRRRWIMGLSMLGLSMGQIVTLYQTGVIKDLPDLPIPFLDAARVDASNYAYSRLNTPDGPLMLINYGITAWLTSTGGENRARETPLIPIAMGAKLLVDCITCVELAREEWSENKAFCEYCQVATLCSLTSLALAVPEVLTAVRSLMGSEEQA